MNPHDLVYLPRLRNDGSLVLQRPLQVFAKRAVLDNAIEFQSRPRVKVVAPLPSTLFVGREGGVARLCSSSG